MDGKKMDLTAPAIFVSLSLVLSWALPELGLGMIFLVSASSLLWRLPEGAMVFGLASPMTYVKRKRIQKKLEKLRSSLLLQRRLQKPIPRPRLHGETSEDMGIVPFPEETDTEKMVLQGKVNVSITAVDSNGQMLVLEVGKGGKLKNLNLRIGDEWYSLLDAGDAMDCFIRGSESVGDSLRTDRGLTLTMLEAFRRWRIVYNGIMSWAALDRPVDCLRDSDLKQIGSKLPDIPSDAKEILTKLSHGILEGMQQFGVVYGKVMTSTESGGAEEKDIYLQGHRILEFEADDKSDVMTLLGVSDNGFQFYARCCKLESRLFALGQLFIPGTDVYPISSIDTQSFNPFEQIQRSKDNTVNPNLASLRFNAAGKDFHVGILLYQHQDDADGRIFKADMSFNSGRGKAILIKEESTESKNDLNYHPLLSGIKHAKDVRDLVLPFESEDCTVEAVVGGKAASLGVMTRSDEMKKAIIVPKGIVVTSNGFQAQLNSMDGFKSVLKEMEEVACKKHYVEEEDRIDDLKDVTKKAVVLMKEAKVVEGIKVTLKTSLTATFGEDRSSLRLAVRSSALGEDSSELSAAGQNETILGVLGGDLDAVEKALKDCWASLYAFQSVEYRRQNGQPVLSSMGVVIQEMVPADAAGVAFSRDPLTGDPSRVVVTANFGLGESVVSALSEPDTVEVNYKPWLKDETKVWSVGQTKTGSKKQKIVMGKESLTEKVDSADLASTKLCLHESIFLKVAKLAVELEVLFGGPRDVEFAVRNGEIYLLQARPITTIESWSDEELLREYDDAVPATNDCEVHTRANTGEVMPGTITNLSSATVRKFIDLGFQKCMVTKFLPQSYGYNAHGSKAMRQFSQQILINYVDSMLFAVMDEPVVTPPLRAIDISVCGHQVVRDQDVENAVERRPVIKGLNKAIKLFDVAKETLRSVYWMKRGMKNWSVATHGKKGFESDVELFREIFEDVDEKMTSREMYEVLVRDCKELILMAGRHCRVSQANTTFQLIVFLTLTENSEDWTTETYADAANIFVNDQDDDVESAGVPKGLKNISEAIASCPGSESLNEKSTDEAEKWILEQSGAGNVYRDFLDKFSHRCLKEFDLASVPWGEDRSPLIKTIQAMVAAKHQEKGERQASMVPLTLEEKIANLSRPIQDSTKKALGFLYPLATGSVALREKSKSVMIAQINQMRKAARLLGAALRREGYLPQGEKLIHHLTLYEIGRLLETRSPVIVQKAQRRNRLSSRWEELRFNEMTYGIPKTVNESDSYDFLSDADGHAVVKGTPGCTGVYRGPARVVTRLEDAKTIQKGEVLVTISTDIGWSPYFPLLGGVVTELGGLISHGAVVAREYGLPCVVGATGATRAFNTGDMVVVDGRKGNITKIE